MKEIEEEIVMQPACVAGRISEDFIGPNSDVGLQSRDMTPKLFGSDGVKVPDGSTTPAASIIPTEGVDPVAPSVEQRIAVWQDWVPLELKKPKKPTKKQQQKINTDKAKLRRWEQSIEVLRSPFNDFGVFKVPISEPTDKEQ